ncbi:hypothetical protein GGR56DRAFT_15076 [Xylariaceae sp. FL0804]|nr:hypothetical protein GGR56DRAFT_15076 [Xylariaceae sp. FL0804]
MRVGFCCPSSSTTVFFSVLIELPRAHKVRCDETRPSCTRCLPSGRVCKALRRIKARVLLMPSRTDACSPPEDNEEEVKHLSSGELVCIESIYGHTAGGGGSKEDIKFIKKEVKHFLDVYL